RPQAAGTAGQARPRGRLVPATAGEAAEGDQAEQNDDDAEPDAPDEENEDPDDDDDAAESESGSRAVATLGCSQVRLLGSGRGFDRGQLLSETCPLDELTNPRLGDELAAL